MIYSSGSVPAQKLLLGYTTEGDARALIGASASPSAGEPAETTGWWDTLNAGPKMESQSYTTIAASMASRGIAASEWLFLSDRVEEVEAAKQAGMRSRVVVRPGNAHLPQEVLEAHGAVRQFGTGELSVNGV
jgi:enolase-phosphatase E1